MRIAGSARFAKALKRRTLPVLLFALAAASVVNTAAARAQLHPWYALAVSTWLVAMLAFVGACLAVDRGRSDLIAMDLGWSAADTVIVAVVVATAATLRLPGLGQIPVTMLGDEAALALEAVRLIEHTQADPFALGWHSHPLMWSFLQSLCMRAFGEGVAGARLLSAGVGSATVGTTYIFGRLLYGRRAATIGAVLLATYHFHIHFSRLAIFNIADPLFGTAILGALIVGLRTRRAAAFGSTGILLGLTLYFYPGAKLFILLIALLGLIQAVPRLLTYDRRRRLLPRQEVLLLAGGALTAAAPLLQTYGQAPQAFTARLRANTITAPGWLREEARISHVPAGQLLWRQFERAALAFTLYPSTDDFYDDRRPLLWGLAALLLPVGLGLALRRYREPEYLLLLLWALLAIVFGGALLKDPPESARFVTLAPVVCLLIAIAVEQGLCLVRRLRPGWARASNGAAAVLTLYLVAASVTGYVHDYLPQRQPGGPNTHAANALARYLERQPAGTKVWFLGMPRMYYHGFPMLDFLAPRVDAADALTLWVMPAPAPGRTTVYAVLPEHRPELEATEKTYPGGRQEILGWPTEAGPLVYVYRLSQSLAFDALAQHGCDRAPTRSAGTGRAAGSTCRPDTHP